MIWQASRKESGYRASSLPLNQCLSLFIHRTLWISARMKMPSASRVVGGSGCRETCKNEALIDALANTPLCSAFSACNYFSPKTAIIFKKKIALLLASLKMDGDFIKHKWQKAKQRPAYWILFSPVQTIHSLVCLELRSVVFSGLWGLRPAGTSTSSKSVSSQAFPWRLDKLLMHETPNSWVIHNRSCLSVRRLYFCLKPCKIIFGMGIVIDATQCEWVILTL